MSYAELFDDVQSALGDYSHQYDVGEIVHELIVIFGNVRVTDLNPHDFWEVVEYYDLNERHD